MVGQRFGVRGGAGKQGYTVWDAGTNGSRGERLTKEAAHQLAADLELQFNTYGPRPPGEVRRTAAPVAVERVTGWAAAGFLDHWVWEGGLWIGRVRKGNDFDWIPQTELRREEGQF